MPTPEQLTRTHQKATRRVADGVVAQLTSMLRSADLSNIDEWFLANEGKIINLIRAGWQSNRNLAAIYLRDHAAASDSYIQVRDALFELARVRTSMLVTGPVAFKRAISAGHPPAVARRMMSEAITGSAFRHAINGSRDTVMESIRRSSTALGYRRVSDGNPCAFCAMLISRGGVYSKETAKFEAHDRDGCLPEPLYRKRPEPESVLKLQKLWEDSTSGLSGKAAIAAFRAAYRNYKP